MILAAAAVLLLSGCDNSHPASKTDVFQPSEAYALFDFTNGGMRWDDTIEFDMDEFPDIGFTWNSMNLTASENGEQRLLFSGMPIWSVYFCDLNGDGKREIISEISLGSGIVDERIIVYDAASSKLYDLSDRFNFDFSLKLSKDGILLYEKRSSSSYFDDPEKTNKSDTALLTMNVLTEKKDGTVW